MRKLFTKIVLGRFVELTKKTETTLDDDFLAAVSDPIRFLPIIMGVFFFAQWFEIPEEVTDFLMIVVRSALAFVIVSRGNKIVLSFFSHLYELVIWVTFISYYYASLEFYLLH